MKIDPEKMLYSFTINLEKEVEEKVEKRSRRKNKETGKMETVTTTEVQQVKKEVPFHVILKKPNN